MGCSVLIIDDDMGVRKGLGAYLSRKNYSVTSVDSAIKGVEKIKAEPPSVVVLDLKMPDEDGFYVLREARAQLAHSTVILFSGYANIDRAVRATKLGADKVVEKPISPTEVEDVIRSMSPNETLPHQDPSILTLDESSIDLVTASESMQEVRDKILLAAKNDSARVLIQGESGTGKEIVARAIWEHNDDRPGEMVDVNCAALSSSLLEAELFGHEKGAFTGATEERAGLFEVAHEGIIFLDEIGEIPMELQPKLLRVLEEGKFKRVGGTENIEADFRVVASTNRDLPKMVNEGEFRRDLFYRLNVFSITIPPLRERSQDIAPLARRMLWRCTRGAQHPLRGYTEEAMDKLKGHTWPGNVRELRNVVERAAMLASDQRVEADDIVFSEFRPEEHNEEVMECTSIEEMERNLIKRVLDAHNWHRTKSADILGINRTTLWQKIKRYDLEE